MQQTMHDVHIVFCEPYAHHNQCKHTQTGIAPEHSDGLLKACRLMSADFTNRLHAAALQFFCKIHHGTSQAKSIQGESDTAQNQKV